MMLIAGLSLHNVLAGKLVCSVTPSLGLPLLYCRAPSRLSQCRSIYCISLHEPRIVTKQGLSERFSHGDFEGLLVIMQI